MSKDDPETREFSGGGEDIRLDGMIPFNRPYLVGSEFERMHEAVKSWDSLLRVRQTTERL